MKKMFKRPKSNRTFKQRMKLRILKLELLAWRAHSIDYGYLSQQVVRYFARIPGERVAHVAIAFIVIFGTAAEYASVVVLANHDPREGRTTDIDERVESLIGAPVEKFSQILEYNHSEDSFKFNENFSPSTGVAGLSGRAGFTADLHDDFGEAGIEITDSINNVYVRTLSLTETERPARDENRVVYPIAGSSSEKIYSLAAASVKEDIILYEAPEEAYQKYDYKLEMSDGLEARLEQDGSIGVYSVDYRLLGNVAASSDEDAELLADARENGVKNTLVFTIPAPFVLEFNKKSTDVLSYFSLKDDVLSLHVNNLDQASYPLSIDPTIYIETAAKLMRGNNETNVDFDTTNELFQKSQTTGARIDDWDSTMSLPEGRWDGQTAVAGGKIYYTGGVYATATDDTIAYVRSESALGTSDTIDIGTAGTNRLVLLFADDESDTTSLTNFQVDGNDCNVVEVANNTSGLGNHQEMWYCDEDDLGSSNGSVTYNITGGDGGWGIVAHLYTGVSQGGPTDSGHVDSETSQTTTTVTNINVPEDGLVAMGAAHGSSGSWTSYTSPLVERTDANYPSSAVFATSSAIETTAQTNKSYTSTASASGNRLTGIVASWDHGVALGSETLNDEVYWAELNQSDNTIISPNPGTGACTNWCTESVYDLPEGLRGHEMVAYNGHLFVMGGEDSTGRVDTVYIAKLGANGEPALWHPTDTDKSNWVYWYEDTGLSGGTEKSYFSAVAYNNRMYVIGGQTDASTGGITTVQQADILPNGRLGTWTTTGMQALPSGAGTHMTDAHVYNDTLYILGGFEGAVTSSANLRATTYYSRLDFDGTMNAWQSTDSFTTARADFGGTYSYIWGAYLYMGGGCEAVNGSGYCTTISNDMQIASINADGSLDQWSSLGSLSNERVGYNLIGWQNGIYRLGGCSNIDTGTGECGTIISGVDYGTINPAGEVSTVNISAASGVAPCSGGSPHSCDLPDVGEGTDEGGQLLSSVTILNGYLYVIGGCVDYDCNGTSPGSTNASGNTYYAAIDSQGLLTQPATCSGTYADSWCVDSTNLINDTGSSTTDGLAAAGVTTFGNRIYVIGGRNGEGVITDIHHNAVNDDGSLDGAWETNDLTDAGFNEDTSYPWAFTRANPSQASTVPGHLFVFGGCGNATDNGLTCGAAAANYETEVYKCEIDTSGDVDNCSTSGQLQIDSDPDTGGDQGLGIHAGAVNANYVYLVGGYNDTEQDKDEVIYAQIDDNNDIVAVTGSEWVESPNRLSVGRRRGAAFGYNGHIYAVGGYDEGQGVLSFIEWSKMDVSDGSIDPFTTSSIEISQRWGLAVAVSNSYAYVVGGCDVGASPNSCSSFEPEVQTFQLYNNDSGAVDNWTAQTDQTFTADTDRWGASAVVHDGYLYVAGGCTSATDCTDTTNNVQYAPISAADGSIGTWATTTMDLPQDRGWGELLEAGGTLYYVGGEDDASDEKSDVYYATPQSAGSAQDVFRTTTYDLASGEFTGTSYTLTLNNDLAENYFVMIAGASTNSSGNNGPDDNQVRVSDDPFGNIGTATASDELDFERGNNGNDWVGSITVIECMVACQTDGFALKEVIDGNLPNTDVSEDFTLSEDHVTNTVPFGGYRGGGLSTAEGDAGDFVSTAGVRVYKNSTDEIRVDRDATDGNASAADITIYVVEWGSNWTVQESNIAAWTAGGDGVDASGEYATGSITSVTRDETWLWKSVGTGSNDGLGNGSFGTVLTLGDGTTTENASESTVAVGSRRNNSKNDTVYVMEHSDLAADYRFTSQASHGTSTTVTVDNATTSETVATNGNITSSEGLRAAFHSISDSGQGLNYTKVAGWDHHYSADGTLSLTKSYSGNSQAMWTISADFAGITYTPTDGDLALWETASNGLVADRTKFGAASWNDRLYVVGGLDDSASDTNTVYVSPQLTNGGDITSAWSSTTTFDVAREGVAVTAYANNLYLFGGYDGADYLNDVQFTQINTDGTVDAWTNTISLPDGLREARAFSANGYMYLVGGRSADTTCVPNTIISPIIANTTIATGNNPTGIGDWYETNVRYTGDRYGAAVAYDDGVFYTMGGGCTSPLSTNRHYESTVLSQPQVAKYSRLIDTDTDVFPTGWLLNGLDNSIGARWEGQYRSMNDTDGVPTDCGSADMTTFGQNTDVGEITLGDVMPFTVLDGSGTDINCGRYFYIFLEIDASRTFGYPEDVNRGPTVHDISFFFTSDPSKRLRHGKTFTGGEKQPLDTPCGQSVDPDCPNP